MKLGMISGLDRPNFDKVKSLGLEFIELCCNNNEDCDRVLSHIDVIQENIAETGISIGSLGRWNSLTNVGGKLDESAMAYHFKMIDAAAKIGSPVYVCGINRDEDVSLFKNYVAAVDFFSALCEEGKKKNVQVAVYNCSWGNFVYTSKDWRIVLSEVGDLKIKYDCSHNAYRAGDYLEELNEWLPRIAHMHVKGVCQINGKHVDDPPAGLDQLDWRSIFALIYAHGYDNGLSIEPHSSVWSGELGLSGVKFTIDFIKQYILR